MKTNMVNPALEGMATYDEHVKVWDRYQWCWECTMIGGYCGNSCCSRNYPSIGRAFLDTQNASEIDPLYALADELVVLKRHTLNLVANVSPDHDEIKPHSYIRWNAMALALRAS